MKPALLAGLVFLACEPAGTPELTPDLEVTRDERPAAYCESTRAQGRMASPEEIRTFFAEHVVAGGDSSKILCFLVGIHEK